MLRFSGVAKGLTSALLSACGLLAVAAQVVQADTISWKSGEAGEFQQRYVDADLKNVLRDIATRNGNEVTIKQDVAGDPITQNYAGKSLRSVFDTLISENDLQYTYDAGSNRVTISRGRDASGFRLFSPENVSLDRIRTALRQYGIQGADVVYDHKIGTMVIRGEADAVSQVLDVAQHLDQSASRRAAVANSRAASESKRELDRLEAEKRRTILDSIKQADIKTAIIPLRYASVGTTTTTFQGQTVSIPGVEETLKTLLATSSSLSLATSESESVIAANTSSDSNSNAFEVNVEGEPGRIAIDTRTNSVIVRGTPRVIADVRKVIKSLDRQVPLVDIEVMIVRAEAGLGRQLGVDWAYARRRGNKTGGVNTGINSGTTVNTDLQSATVNPITLLPIVTGSPLENIVASFIFDGSRTFFQAQISALAEKDKLEVISTPHVMTLNNIAAKISDSTTLYIPVDTGDAGGAGDLRAVNAGLSLDITPSVFDGEAQGADSLVRLSINATNESFTAGTANKTGQEVQSQIIIRDGATFVMGGLFTSTRRETEDGIPGLKDLPLLGTLFKTNGSEDNRQETIFFITPSVIQPDSLRSSDVAYYQNIRKSREMAGERAKEFVSMQNQRLDHDTLRLHRDSQLLDMTRAIEEDE